METRKVKVIKIGIIVLLFLLLDPTSVRAERMTEQEIRAAVTTWVRHVTAGARPDAVIKKMEPYTQEEDIVAYIAHLEGEGYCLCSVDDRLWPVYIYSPDGTYDPGDQGDRYFLSMISDLLDYAKEYETEEKIKSATDYHEEMDFRRRYWEDLINGRMPQMIIQEGIKGFSPGSVPNKLILNMTSIWGQQKPYNYLTPPRISKNEIDNCGQTNASAGCGPIAASQIMRYWEWPPYGKGQDDVSYDYRAADYTCSWPSYNDPLYSVVFSDDPMINGAKFSGRLRWYNNKYLQIRGYWDSELYDKAKDFNKGESYHQDYLDALEILWDHMHERSETYEADFTDSINWNLIRDNHHSGTTSDIQDTEVADLIFRVGVAMNADYGMIGTSTNIYQEWPWWEPGAEEAFEDHFYYDRDAQVRDSGIWDKIIDEISWLRPVYIRGESSNKSKDNFGKAKHSWVVFGYRYYNNQEQTRVNSGNSWVQWKTEDNYFPSDQKILRRIAPKRIVKFVGDANSGDGSPSDPYRDIEEALNEIPSETKTLIFKAGSINTVPDGFAMYSPHGHALSTKTSISPDGNSGIYQVVIKPE